MAVSLREKTREARMDTNRTRMKMDGERQKEKMQHIQKRSMMPVMMVTGLVMGLFAMVAMTQQAITTIENPIVEIVAFGESGDGVGLFNTATGEIQVFNGDPSTAGTHGDWAYEVSGVVENQPAGSLRIQNPLRGPGLFMVNVKTGDTWVLREPRKHSWYWSPIRSAR